MKFLAGIVGGLILAVLAGFLVTLTLAGGKDSDPTTGVMSFFLAWGAGLVIALMAPTASKAWRRLLITSAVFSFLLPISGLIYTGSFIANHTSGDGAEVAGATIGGGLLSGALGFVGFFLGVVFLVIGLLVGREKQVVYVQAPHGQMPTQAPQAGAAGAGYLPPMAAPAPGGNPRTASRPQGVART